MTKFQHCYEGAATRSSSLTWKSLLTQSLFKTSNTTLETTATHVALWLERGECISISAAHVLQIECSEGEAWVTIEGDLRDYLLSSHQDLPIPSGVRAVVQARTGSRMTIKPE
ncbi:MAG: DUF2917 domain-containing protein [Capsulimonas sp.]|uniref:DUF2917 domain-containing protein n=1 Tax=Capsulimonas sp. TaxID=2494211 RepID=UPI0032659233